MYFFSLQVNQFGQKYEKKREKYPFLFDYYVVIFFWVLLFGYLYLLKNGHENGVKRRKNTENAATSNSHKRHSESLNLSDNGIVREVGLGADLGDCGPTEDDIGDVLIIYREERATVLNASAT